MRKLRNRGLTYIEVMVTTSIVSIMMLSIFMSLYQMARKITYAQNSYIGSLYAENLLIDATNAIDSVAVGAGIIEMTLLIPDFNTRYDTDTFDFGLVFYPATGTEDAVIYSTLTDDLSISSGLYTENLEGFYGTSSLLGDEVTLYDGGMLRIDGGGVESTTIRFPVVSEEKISLRIMNDSTSSANINIYDDQMIEPHIAKGSVLIRYFSIDESPKYIIKAIVFDKRGIIIKNLFKFSP